MCHIWHTWCLLQSGCVMLKVQSLCSESDTSVYHFCLYRFHCVHKGATPVFGGVTADVRLVRHVSDQISFSDIVRCHGRSPDVLATSRLATAFVGRVCRSEVTRGRRSGSSESMRRGCGGGWGVGWFRLPMGVHDCVNDWGGNNILTWKYDEFSTNWIQTGDQVDSPSSCRWTRLSSFKIDVISWNAVATELTDVLSLSWQ